MAGIAPERIGYVLDGKYEILSEVGHGGMSVVFLARDKRLNKQWAIKEFRRTGDRHTEKIFRKSLMEEAQLMKGLDHPALPRIVDIIEADETVFIVMDFVEGEDLKKVMKKQGRPFTEREVVDLGIQLCDVLDYLHTPVVGSASNPGKPTIVYRDMKPQNVMVNDKGVARLVDFGIARKFDGGKDGDTTIGGTEGYAAPEQLDDSVETDPRADIYSLGITLHYLVTGHNPRKDVHNARPIREYNAQLSEGLEAIIAKCTAYRREDRYQSCREVAYDLEHYETLTPEFRAKKKRKVNTFLGMSIAAVVFLAVGVGCLVGSNAVKQSTFEAYYSRGNEASSSDDKIEAYKEAIKVDPSRYEPYEAILDVFIDDGEFDSDDEGSEFQELLSDSAKEHCADSVYADLCYQFATVYFSYMENDSQANYSQAYTWFKNADDIYGALSEKSLSEDEKNLLEKNKTNAEAFMTICEFNTKLNSRDKLGALDESDLFKEYWDKLVEACDEIEDSAADARTTLKLYELVMDACLSSAYTTAFMNAGIAEEDLLGEIDRACNGTLNLKDDIVHETISGDKTSSGEIYDGIVNNTDKAKKVVEETYHSTISTALGSDPDASSSNTDQANASAGDGAGE